MSTLLWPYMFLKLNTTVNNGIMKNSPEYFELDFWSLKGMNKPGLSAFIFQKSRCLEKSQYCNELKANYQINPGWRNNCLNLWSHLSPFEDVNIQNKTACTECARCSRQERENQNERASPSEHIITEEVIGREF